MATPKRPDQRTQTPVPYAPGSRSGAGATLQLSTTGLALDTTVAQVNATLGAPGQQGTLASLLTQIQQAGAQPFVPGMRSASQILQGPSVTTFHTFTAASRLWGASVSYGAGTSGGSGTTNLYALVKTGGGVVLAITEICVAGTVANNSNSATVTIPGLPVSSGDKLIFDVNNGVVLSGGIQRGSCNVLYSVP